MKSALIVAHGSPAEPGPQETALQALAVQVQALLPDWRITSATLAQPGALEAGLHAAGESALIYPFFMASGWFTGRELPRRLALAGARSIRQLPPFGHEPGLPALLARVATAAARDQNFRPEDTRLLLAAHGSKVSRRSAEITQLMAAEMRRRTKFAEVTCGFVEEAPFLEDAARREGKTICLPFFALRAGHVAGDVPEALARAGFGGILLPAIGEHRDAARLIADGLERAAGGQPPRPPAQGGVTPP